MTVVELLVDIDVAVVACACFDPRIVMRHINSKNVDVHTQKEREREIEFRPMEYSSFRAEESRNVWF